MCSNEVPTYDGIVILLAVKASLVKLKEKEKTPLSKREIEVRLHQMLERSIISEDVIDVFDAMGIKRPEISILSEEFLKEVQGMKQKNLAVEMLKKLLEGNIKTMEKRNLVKSEKFSERLTKALNKYRNQALTNAEVIEELIRMAHDIKKMREEEAELGLSDDEIAFYDALTADDIVKEIMEDETLKKIAHELTLAIRNNITIDWSVRKSSRASMRRVIKRLLSKYHYPPDQALKAMNIVMRQAEKMAGNVYEEVIWSDRVAEEPANFTVIEEDITHEEIIKSIHLIQYSTLSQVPQENNLRKQWKVIYCKRGCLKLNLEIDYISWQKDIQNLFMKGSSTKGIPAG